MPVRVSPTIDRPTHHISLQDRNGKTIGLILCDDNGVPLSDLRNVFIKNPVDTTAQKQTSGTSSYNDYQYPYSPIVQDDLSGGRGNLDFERDSTKFYDSFRTRSSRANKAFAGPQEQYVSGLHSQDQSMPGSVKWHELRETQRYIYKKFTASASYTVGLAWLLARTKGSPSDLTVAFYSDSAGTVNTLLSSITIDASDRMADTLSEWLCETVSQAITIGTAYWFVVYAASTDDSNNHWKIAIEDSPGTTYYSAAFDSTPSAASFDLYYRLAPAFTNKTCIPFDYKEGKYFVVSAASGAPNLYIAGDRGTADANTGQLTKLIDATKSWTTNEWAGSVVKIIDGLGVNEPQPWRVVASNTSSQLVFDDPWTITHDTTTEYVIFGEKITEITGHGLTAPVTDVEVTTRGIILFAQGDSTNIRRMKEETSAGVWTRTYADDGTNKAVFLDYKPQAQKIVKANNRDGSNNTSIALADPVDWATASHTFATAVNVDSKYIRINGTRVYPDEGGTEALWVFKEDLPYIVPGTGNPYPLTLEEMKTVRSDKNGRSPLVNNVYLLFPMGYGLERYYGGSIDDIGPNLNEGLPDNRRGAINTMLGYPGKFFISIDAGDSGYSSILDSGGWHERYRAPLGQRILATSFQVIPGTVPDRLWIYQGNDLLYLPFPSETTNELEDENYSYTHEFAIILSRMHAGLFDVMKLVKKIKLQTENLETDTTTGEPVCWFELDYRLNEDTEWLEAPEIFDTSPTQDLDFTPQYGLAGKRMQFRIRGYTTDNTKTPVFLAVVINAVLRTDVKYLYGSVSFRAMDNEDLLTLNEQEDDPVGMNKVRQIEDWADASSDSMLKMNSVSPLFDDKMIFLNTPSTRQVTFQGKDGSEFVNATYVMVASFQEA
jgi:hypothetical protein